METDGRKKKHRKQVSQKQLTAISLHAQGLSKTEAMRRAGYAKSMLNVPKKVFTSQAIVTAVDKFKLELKDLGLATDYMAVKLKEFIEAEDRHGNPDYLTQIQAFKLLKEVLIDQDLKAKTPEGSQMARRLTVEEFIVKEGQPQSPKAPKLPLNGQEVEELTPHIKDDDPADDIDETKESQIDELII